jgi:hypothetical protein
LPDRIWNCVAIVEPTTCSGGCRRPRRPA